MEASTIAVSCAECFLVGPMEKEVRVEWRLGASGVNLIDWIGMYEVDEHNPLLYLDYKSYGVCGAPMGSVNWHLHASQFTYSASDELSICFRYYDGLTGSLRASSPPILVYSKGRLLIEALQCSNLEQKQAGYYAKIRCGKHNYRTGLSESAVWTDLNYIFPVDLSREIQVIVKERCWSGDRVTGEINVPIADVVVQTKSDLAFVLRPSATTSSASLNPITFSLGAVPRPMQFDSRILIRCRVVPEHSETFDETMHSLRGSQPPRTFLATTEEEAPPPARDRDAMSISSDDRPSTSSSSSSSSGSAKLPSGWEARLDRHGRVFYIDHANKRTTWEPPSPGDASDPEMPAALESLKFSCARRTVLSKPPTTSFDSFPLPVQFLLRSDFITLLQSNQAALKMYNNSVCLKHMLHRIRHDPTKFDRFEKNSELVVFLNLFADVTQPLPTGWQIAQHSQNRVLYIDHDSKKISLIDPRLPGEVRRRTRSAPPARRKQIDLNGNNIMDILTRTEEIKELVSKRLPELAPKICKKLQIISKMGEPGLLRFANDIDLITAISVLECEQQTVTSDFEDKLNYFYSSLQKSGYGQGPEKIRFRLRRSNLLSDAYDKILAVSPIYLRRCIMTVAFDEEDGLDYGGPSRELFFLLSRELFNPQCGLFEYSANDSYTVQISPMSKFVDNFVRWFELAGRVLGLALIHRCLIDTFFTRAFYKFLLGRPFTISDLQTMDAQFHQSLKWVKENTVTPELDLTFSATQEVGGEIAEKELVSNGRNIAVTEENKNEFLALMVRWRIERGVEEQGKALLRGLYQVVDKEYLQVFDAEQLELVLSGTVVIDIEDWQLHTEYKGGYHENHVVVAWFWSTVYAMSNADRLKLLQFVTGTSSIPCEGFKALRGSNGPRKFTIEKWGSEDALPRAHTCFNRLDLPCYPTSQVLTAKLNTAINESSSYAIE